MRVLSQDRQRGGCRGGARAGVAAVIRSVAFVCVTTVEALTHRAVLHHPEVLSEEGSAALVDEATRLLVRYLQ